MRYAPLIALLLGSVGCTGEIGDTDGPTNPTGDALCGPGPAPMRRLTRWEYDNTVHDLLGDTTQPARGFVPEASQFGFDNAAAGATLSDVVVEQFESAARALAKTAAQDLPTLLQCDPAVEGESTCTEAFLDRFGRRAFRRPLTEEERTRYLAFFEDQRATYDLPTAMELLTSALLQSPHFLYRIELATPGEADVPVRGFEMASRLSYFLWGSMPDDELLDAANQGRLESADDVRREAERMLAHEYGGRAYKNFFSQWAELRDLPLVERDPAVFTASMPALLTKEVELFVDDVLANEGTLRALLTSNASFVNAELATHYGLPGTFGEEFERTTLDPERYPGLLTRGGLLAVLAHPDQPSPVLRGKFIREQVFCDPPPPPPCDVDLTLPPIDPNATAREQLEQKTSVQPCLSCHSFLNPPGFAFDHFDQHGRWRDDDHGLPIDTTGDLTMTDVDGPFESHAELAERFAESDQVRDCMVTHWYRYAHGRDVLEDDQCSYDAVQKAFEESDGDLRELVLALVSTPNFLMRAGGQ
jgi:hypothetical protein